MAFKFRLEPILALRQQKEDTLQVELAVNQRELAAAQRHLIVLESTQHDQMASLRGRQNTARVDVALLHQGFIYLDALAGAIAGQRDHTIELAAGAEEKRQEVVRAMQERKSLEKLKDRARVRYLDQVARAEAAVAEDATVAQYHRIRRGEA